MPDVADMKVVVHGDVKGLEAAMGRAKASVSGFEGSAAKALGSVDGALSRMQGGFLGLAKALPVIGLAATAIGILGSQLENLETWRKDSLGFATALLKLGDEVGISARNLQILGAAFENADEDRAQMEGGLKSLAETLKKARDGDAGAASGFKALGVSLVDVEGKQRSQMAILRDIIEEMRKTEDETYRLRIATLLFGEAAAEAWVKIAEKGKEGLAQVAKDAESAGKIVSDEHLRMTATIDRQLEEVLKKATTQWEKMKMVALGALREVASAASDGLGKMTLNPALMTPASQDQFLASMQSRIDGLIADSKRLNDELGRLADPGGVASRSNPGLKAQRDVLEANIERTQIEIVKTAEQYRAFKELVDKIRAEAPKPAGEDKPGAPQARVPLPPLPGEGRGGESDPLAWLARQVREMERYAMTLGLTAGEAAKLKAEEEGLQRLREAGKEVTPELEERVKKYAEALRVATDRTNELKQTMADLRESGQIMARGIESAFTSWMQTGKFNSKEMVRSILQDLMKLSLQVALLRPLFGGGAGGGTGLFGNLLGSLLVPGYGGGAGMAGANANVARAYGGPVKAGREYMVGELGPERFRAAVDGVIIPASQSSGGGAMSSVMNVSINAAGADPAGLARVERAVQDLNRTFEKRVRASQHREQVRGVRAS